MMWRRHRVDLARQNSSAIAPQMPWVPFPRACEASYSVARGRRQSYGTIGHAVPVTSKSELFEWIVILRRLPASREEAVISAPAQEGPGFRSIALRRFLWEPMKNAGQTMMLSGNFHVHPQKMAADALPRQAIMFTERAMSPTPIFVGERPLGQYSRGSDVMTRAGRRLRNTHEVSLAGACCRR